MKPATLVVAALLFLPAIGHGRDLYEAAKDAQNEVAGELSACAAYYVLSGAMFRSSDPSPDRDKGIAGAKQAGEAAITLSAKMSSDEVAAARTELALQTMQREMQNDWSKFSLVAVKYAWSCKDVVEHPDQRLAYWVKEKAKLPDGPRQPK